MQEKNERYKRRKILSITFGDSAQTLKRTRFEEDRHIKNEKEVSYVLTTYETYHESELFKTRLELENGLYQSDFDRVLLGETEVMGITDSESLIEESNSEPEEGGEDA